MGSASSVSPIDRGASTASAQPLLPAGARHERTLEGVACKLWFGFAVCPPPEPQEEAVRQS
jgi:hypothetical protein